MDPKEEITFDDFAKMQFQVGEILSCEAVAKSKKLLCSQVKIGNTVKQIVSGIRKDYTPEEMVGKKVMVLVNLSRQNLPEYCPRACCCVQRTKTAHFL